MRVGPYEVVCKLGEGGMGVVFAARGPSGERVALKVLRHDAFLDHEELARFDREARPPRAGQQPPRLGRPPPGAEGAAGPG